VYEDARKWRIHVCGDDNGRISLSDIYENKNPKKKKAKYSESNIFNDALRKQDGDVERSITKSGTHFPCAFWYFLKFHLNP
jgi:hypothetical protein